MMLKKLLVASILATTAHGFMKPSPTTTKTSLDVATGKDWAKPKQPTEPVPVKSVSKMERQFIKDRVIDPDYRLALGTFLLGPLIAWYHPCELL